jgi:hypothetical protein
MGGIINEETANITPNCRYGHGYLVRQEADGATQFMAPVAGTMMGYVVDGNQVSTMPWAYSFSIYKCLKCSYMELHDDFPIPEAQ